MNNVNQFIESGILEMYVLGSATPAEAIEVERMSLLFEEVRSEIEAISIALEKYAVAQSVAVPDPFTGPMLMAKIDYMERLKGGEQPSFPPVLHSSSKIEDYNEWLTRSDLQFTYPTEDAVIHIIGYTPEVESAIVYLKYGAPPEVHSNEFEQFLIVEGTCDIIIEAETHSMKPGDVLIVPLYKTHYVKVTSEIPCKILLQRVAA